VGWRRGVAPWGGAVGWRRGVAPPATVPGIHLEQGRVRRPPLVPDISRGAPLLNPPPWAPATARGQPCLGRWHTTSSGSGDPAWGQAEARKNLPPPTPLTSFSSPREQQQRHASPPLLVAQGAARGEERGNGAPLTPNLPPTACRCEAPQSARFRTCSEAHGAHAAHSGALSGAAPLADGWVAPWRAHQRRTRLHLQETSSDRKCIKAEAGKPGFIPTM